MPCTAWPFSSREASAFRTTGSVAVSVLPSPVFISAMEPSWRTMPPISWTSKWRWPEGALAGLARERKRLVEEVLERLAVQVPLAQALVALAELVVGLELELGLEGVDQLDVALERLELLRPRRRGARGPESTSLSNGSKGQGRGERPLAVPKRRVLARRAAAPRGGPALVAMLLHLTREVVRHEVHRVPHVVGALARSERHSLEAAARPRRPANRLSRLLPELDRQLGQRRDLPRNLAQLLLHTREKLVVRACAASTLHLDAHLPSWTLGTR